MARGINKAIILGNVGQDPEVRFLPNGNPVANLSVATSEAWTDKQSGQKQERTEWHRVVAFNKLAEIIQQYVKKGSKIYIEGKIQTRKWQGQDGQDRYSTEIVANDMQMLDSRQGGQQQGYQQQAPQHQQYQQQPQQQPQNYQQAQAQYAQQQGQAQGQPQQAGGFDDFNDEIPFMRMHPMQGG